MCDDLIPTCSSLSSVDPSLRDRVLNSCRARSQAHTLLPFPSRYTPSSL
jgi:hypothetical protein